MCSFLSDYDILSTDWLRMAESLNQVYDQHMALSPLRQFFRP